MELILIRAFSAFIIAFFITFYLIPQVCKLAFRLQLIDVPDGAIKLHKKPTPYLGGVAVYCGLLCSLALIFPFENNFFLFFIGITVLLFVGLIDDLIMLKPYQKLLGQLIAVYCFVKSGFYLKEHFFYSYWGIFLSALWMLVVINAFNLVDVMDGLAAIISLMASLSFLIIALSMNNYAIVILLCAFMGALTAFFWYNKPTAQIYLGDAGSLFIGGFLATIPFLFNWGSYNVYGYITPIVILAIPLLEITSLILIRTYKGIPFYYGSPDHFSNYLQYNGWSKQAILVYIASLSAVLAVSSFLYVKNLLHISSLLVLAFIFLSVWIVILLLKR